jgi:hypothetical protein
MKYFSKVAAEEASKVKTWVKFSELEIGTYFTQDSNGGELSQKISNSKSNNTLYVYADAAVEILTYCPDDTVYICDVEIKWRVR